MKTSCNVSKKRLARNRVTLKRRERSWRRN
jgi:hypothetical protein